MKTVIITGASSGIGLALARMFAARGDAVGMVCRDLARGAAAADSVRRIAAGPAPTVFVADLSSQAEIRALACEIDRRVDHIDVLINNAGAAFRTRALTVDGIERTFAVNHLAAFLLTNLLADRLRAAPAARVVVVGAAVYPSQLDFSNLQGEHHYSMMGAYLRSKLENLIFTIELSRRLAETNVIANCCGPVGVRTNFANRVGGTMAAVFRYLQWLPIIQSPEDGARTPYYLATSPEVANVSGGFFRERRQRTPKPIALDAAVGARLWALSESLVKRQWGDRSYA